MILIAHREAHYRHLVNRAAFRARLLPAILSSPGLDHQLSPLQPEAATGEIRTPDPPIGIRALYPAELLPFAYPRGHGRHMGSIGGRVKMGRTRI